MNRIALFLMCLASAVLTGCATPMAFQSDKDAVSTQSNPVYLMTVDLKNDWKQRYQPAIRAKVQAWWEGR